MEKMLNSLDTVSAARPSKSFMDKVVADALRAQEATLQVSRLAIFTVAASLTLLLVANVLIMGSSTNTQQTSLEPSVEGAYSDLIPTKSLYNE